MTTLNPAVARVLKRLHYPLDVMLTCVRWYVAYPLSLRHIEEMMAERGISVDHSTVHRWAIKLLPVLEKAFRRRKRPVGRSWRMDESVSRTQAKACGAVPKMGVGLPKSACRSGLQCVTNAGVSLRCCTRDGSRPPEIGLQEQISNRPVRLRSKDVVVSDCGKDIMKMSGTC
ncbi:hypothetical protein B0G76_5358 [Paraburkholderia sp. BL23I1N1]|nr:hypothetical protein B0G76_5358 [Paraburkholderia sp. BL23I1N1]